MSAIGALTRWNQPCAIGCSWCVPGARVVVTRWCGVTATLYTRHDVEACVHVVTCEVEVYHA